VKQWQRDHFLHLTINLYYWDRKNVSLHEIFISMVKEIRVVFEMFNRGELDWIGDPFSHLPLKDDDSPTKRSEQSPRDVAKASLQTKRVDRVYWICLNTLSFPLQSAKIRKALAIAINRKQITNDLFDGHPPLLSPISNPGSKKSLSSDGDILLAQQLFNEGLEEVGLTHATFPPITFSYSTTSSQELLAKMIKHQLESGLKITLNLVEVDWNILSNLIDKKSYQLVGYFKSAPYCYPSSDLEAFRECLRPGNDSQWENPAYLSFLDQAHKTGEQKMKEALLKKAEEILLEEMPVIPLFQQVYKCLVHQKIKKNVIHKNGDVDLKFILL
jgi:oligopeptide transport system substrate-binding protein